MIGSEWSSRCDTISVAETRLRRVGVGCAWGMGEEQVRVFEGMRYQNVNVAPKASLWVLNGRFYRI